MSEADQRRLFMLFCLRCGDVLGTLQEQDIAFALRITLAELLVTKQVFIEKGFIDKNWKILNWEKRQFASDSSTDRTRRYRERMRTSQERHSDGLDTDTDTKKKENRKDEDSVRGIFDIGIPGWLPLEDWNGWMGVRLVKKDKNGRLVPWTAHCAKIALGKLERWKDQNYDLTLILNAATLGNWQGLYLPKDDHGQEIKPKTKWRRGDPNNPADWAAATIIGGETLQ